MLFRSIPDTVLKNENERAIFMRRAQREIPELLATGLRYCMNTVALRFIPHRGA